MYELMGTALYILSIHGNVVQMQGAGLRIFLGKGIIPKISVIFSRVARWSFICGFLDGISKFLILKTPQIREIEE